MHRFIINNRYDARCRIFKVQGFFIYNNPKAEAQKEFHAGGIEL